MNVVVPLLLSAALLATGYFVLARVRTDYKLRGKLTQPTAFLQTGFFCAYALASYVFLDSRFSHITTFKPLYYLAVACMAAGLLMLVASMPFLGRRSFGMEVGGLRTTGLYRYSRNPQLVGGFFFIVGYAMLWPSWTGALWASIWLPVAHWMVRGEEAHLERVFQEAYRAYCLRTPRYLGLPVKGS